MRRLIAVGSLLLVGTAQPPSPEPPPGEGVLCMMALVDVTAEVGRQCFAGKDPAFQERIEQVEGQFDSYFIKNGPATVEQLAKFKHDQASLGAPARDCKAGGDAVSIYKTFEKADPEQLAAGVKSLLARPGKPTFGDCL